MTEEKKWRPRKKNFKKREKKVSAFSRKKEEENYE